MRVGYIRVSAVDQNTVRQLDGIAVERTFIDKASGKDTARPQLEELIGFVRDGDTVIVHSMDRLARNLDDLRRLVRTLTGKGVRVEFVKRGCVRPPPRLTSTGSKRGSARSSASALSGDMRTTVLLWCHTPPRRLPVAAGPAQSPPCDGRGHAQILQVGDDHQRTAVVTPPHTQRNQRNHTGGE
ncbi:recombinase family protein [Nocardia sp. CY41]|uniref:recombinase family protein n=1 Tax=Nocardia sp. CY41 TaxID=2608686 RepID=UPI001F358B0F